MIHKLSYTRLGVTTFYNRSSFELASVGGPFYICLQDATRYYSITYIRMRFITRKCEELLATSNLAEFQTGSSSLVTRILRDKAQYRHSLVGQNFKALRTIFRTDFVPKTSFKFKAKQLKSKMA